jgi:hypothetical protein
MTLQELLFLGTNSTVQGLMQTSSTMLGVSYVMTVLIVVCVPSVLGLSLHGTLLVVVCFHLSFRCLAVSLAADEDETAAVVPVVALTKLQ